jgi:hypothetical protein
LTRVAFSSAGDRLLLGAYEAMFGTRVLVWDLTADAPIREIPVPGAKRCVFSPEGMLALVGASVVDLETGETLGVMSEPWEEPIALVPRTSLALGFHDVLGNWLFDAQSRGPAQKLDDSPHWSWAPYPDGSAVVGVAGTRLERWRVPRSTP